jgi:hypothetical protein
MAVLERVCPLPGRAARVTVVDAKRGDIGSTMAAYADAWSVGRPLGRGRGDRLTRNLGFGSLRPVLDVAAATGRGVRAGAHLESGGPAGATRPGDDGRTVAQRILDAVARRTPGPPRWGRWGGDRCHCGLPPEPGTTCPRQRAVTGPVDRGPGGDGRRPPRGVWLCPAAGVAQLQSRGAVGRSHRWRGSGTRRGRPWTGSGRCWPPGADGGRPERHRRVPGRDLPVRRLSPDVDTRAPAGPPLLPVPRGDGACEKLRISSESASKTTPSSESAGRAHAASSGPRFGV